MALGGDMREKAGRRAGYRPALGSRDLRRLAGSRLVPTSGSRVCNVALVVLLSGRARLAIAHPSSRALGPLLHGHGQGNAGSGRLAGRRVTRINLNEVAGIG